MSWKGLKVIGIINVIFLILVMIFQTIFLLGILLHIEALTRHSRAEGDITAIIIIWILLMIINLILLYFNYGLINKNSPDYIRNWLIAHSIAFFLCLGNNIMSVNGGDILSPNIVAMVLLIEIILVIVFCYVIPSAGGSNQFANV
ncbi:uncharacterized protein LOC100568929 [Acyrthosiphon pisum]|uniref:Uncharacterized protein n=1 Tax=Acyrthosiphon pisum TaxID=7029 RepID=A0A8R2AED6_ACYPI|nr:uncharacterized protein LOC100568929 [Acyrthosiphon pisum]|eukprot:XP_003245390.1 PREDICTED: uncharacterized protein LOC100568929 [Acyrthosiphon pisum]